MKQDEFEKAIMSGELDTDKSRHILFVTKELIKSIIEMEYGITPNSPMYYLNAQTKLLDCITCAVGMINEMSPDVAVETSAKVEEYLARYKSNKLPTNDAEIVGTCIGKVVITYS